MAKHWGARIGAATILSGCVVAGINPAAAGGFGLREQSASGLGMAFSGVAAGASLSTMFWNPATLAAVQGLQVESVVSGIAPNADVTLATPATQAQGDIGQDAIVPASYVGYRFSEMISFGLGINGPFGLATNMPSNSLLRGGAAGTSKVFTLNANPAVALRINEAFAVALGAQVQYAKVRLTSLGIPNREYKGDSVGIGLTAGLTWTPSKGTEIGLGYRSRIDNDLSGTLLDNGTRLSGSTTLITPDMITLGIRQAVTDRLTIAGTFEWTNWSTVGTLHMKARPRRSCRSSLSSITTATTCRSARNTTSTRPPSSGSARPTSFRRSTSRTVPSASRTATACG